MATSNFGKLCDYDSNKEDRQSFVERLELFFTANDVADVQKKRAILLTSCGIETYRLFKGLTASAKPVEKTFTELVKLMTNHENLKRNPIAERFQFNVRFRKTGESVSQYIAELRRLSQYCKYGDSLDSMLIHRQRIFLFCKNKGHTSKVCRKKTKSSLPIKHSSIVVGNYLGRELRG